MATLALVFASLLCLLFESTRRIGVVGVSLLFYLHPLVCTALLISGGAVFFFHKRRMRKMVLQDWIHEAIDVVLSWDLPDEVLPDVVIAQAELMAGVCPD